MDTEKQRQNRCSDVRLTESRMPEAYSLQSLTNTEWLSGDLLSELECQRPGWFFRYEISDLFSSY